MLGHLKPHLCTLTEDNKTQYWTNYCSICSSLRQNNSLPYGVLINNELTMLLLAFNPFMEDAQKGETACPAKCFTKQKNKLDHPAIDLAGNLSVLLGWIKVLDWRTDAPNLGNKILLTGIQGRAKKYLDRLSPKLQQTLTNYAKLTQNNHRGNAELISFETLKKQSGILAKEMAEEIGALTTAPETFVAFQAENFRLVGELILMADHLMDIETDLYKKQYNPIIQRMEANKSSLAVEYIVLLNEFNACKNQLRQRLYEEINPAFESVLYKTLSSLEKKVGRNTPAFAKDAKYDLDGIPVLEKAECDACCECCCDDDGGADFCCCCCGTDCCDCCDSSEKKRQKELKKQEELRKKEEKRRKKEEKLRIKEEKRRKRKG